MSYRCALLGCGGRQRSHAKAYGLVTRGKIVAICDMNEKRLNDFGDTFSIKTRYTNLDEMLQKEKPDVVHMTMAPTIRASLMTRLADAGVPGVIVEKPICVGADDYKALRALNARSKTKFVVNHQLRHHPKLLELLKYVGEGKIGEVRFIDASCGLPMAGQGVHVLDLMFAFNGYAKAKSVFGALSGWEDLKGTHPGPNTAEYVIGFENGVRGVLQSGPGAPMYDDGADPTWTHYQKRVAVYGTHGFVHWRMQAWERSLPDGTVERGRKLYPEEDLPGQAGLTNAMFDWLDDGAKVHPNNLATSLDEWLVVIAGYASAVRKAAIALPFDPPDDLLDQVKQSVATAPPK